MIDEEVKNVKGDWVTFNNENIILRIDHYEPQHPACHKNFKQEDSDELEPDELKGKNRVKTHRSFVLSTSHQIKSFFW